MLCLYDNLTALAARCNSLNEKVRQIHVRLLAVAKQKTSPSLEESRGLAKARTT